MKESEWQQSERREALRRMRVIVIAGAIFVIALWVLVINLRS
jgi:hypothetical protein